MSDLSDVTTETAQAVRSSTCFVAVKTVQSGNSSVSIIFVLNRVV